MRHAASHAPTHGEGYCRASTQTKQTTSKPPANHQQTTTKPPPNHQQPGKQEHNKRNRHTHAHTHTHIHTHTHKLCNDGAWTNRSRMYSSRLSGAKHREATLENRVTTLMLLRISRMMYRPVECRHHTVWVPESPTKMSWKGRGTQQPPHKDSRCRPREGSEAIGAG